MNPVNLRVQLAAANAALLVASATPVSGTAMTQTASQPDAARRILLTYGNEAAPRTMRITGTNWAGNQITETLSIPSGAGGTVATNLDFLTVTQVMPLGGGWTAAVTVGTNATGSSPWYYREWMNMGQMGVFLNIGQAANVTASFEVTMDDPNVIQDISPYQASPEPQSNYPPVPFVLPGWGGLTGSKSEMINFPFFAWRLTVTAGTDPAALQVIETTLSSDRAG